MSTQNENEGNDRARLRTFLFALLFVVAVIVFGLYAPYVASNVVPALVDHKISVCEVEPKLIVTIQESDFNKKVYSKNLEDCR